MKKHSTFNRICLDEKAFLKAKENVAIATKETLDLLNSKSYLKVKLNASSIQTKKKLSKNNSVCRYA